MYAFRILGVMGLLWSSSILSTVFAKDCGVENRWGIWDAEIQRLTTADVLYLRKEFRAGIYFFRTFGDDSGHQTVSLAAFNPRKIRLSGMKLYRVIHPLIRVPEETLMSIGRYRLWALNQAVEALDHPDVQGIVYDAENKYISGKNHRKLLKDLKFEAEKRGKCFGVAVPDDPHYEVFRLNWSDYERHADFILPWLYHKNGSSQYKRGILHMLRTWEEMGVRKPVYPIYDFGRTLQKGLSPQEALEVPKYLASNGVKTIIQFQTIIPFLCAFHCCGFKNNQCVASNAYLQRYPESIAPDSASIFRHHFESLRINYGY